MIEATSKSISIILVDILFKLETCDDSKVDPDYSVIIMEEVSASLREFDDSELSKFLDLIAKSAASEENENKRIFMENFADNFGLS